MTEYNRGTENFNSHPVAKVDLVLRLLTLAFDASAPEGEATVAAQKAVAIAKQNGLDFHALGQHLAAANGNRSRSTTVTVRETRMPFGKYRSQTLGAILQNDPDYLHWVLRECSRTSPALCQRIAKMLSGVSR